MHDWFREVWKKRDKVFFNSRGLLILDSMKAHIKESVITSSKQKTIGTELSVIPGRLAIMLQPLDLSVKKSFKSHIRMCSEKWMLEGLHTFTKNRNMRHASYVEVDQWVYRAWISVTPATVIARFMKAGIIPKPEERGAAEITAGEESDNEVSDSLPEHILKLFNSDSEESDFEGFS